MAITRLSPKYQKRLMYLTAVFIILAVLLSSPVFALPFGSITKTVNGVLKSMISDIVGGSVSAKSVTILTTPPWQSPKEGSDVPSFTEAWKVAKGIFTNTIQPVAFSIIGVCFMIRVVQNASHFDQVTPARVLYGPLVTLFACVAVTWYSLTITEYLIRFGALFAKAINSAAVDAKLGDMDGIMSRFGELDKKGNIKVTTAIGYIIRLFFPWLACKLAQLITEVVAMVTMVEIVLRGMFLPLSCSDLMINGTNGGGFRFLRGYLGVVLQAAIILAIGAIQGGLCVAILSGKTGTAFTDFFADVGSLILFQIVGVGLMLRASTLAREIVGA